MKVNSWAMFSLAICVLILMTACVRKTANGNEAPVSGEQPAPQEQPDDDEQELLSELQVVACNSADKGKTCDTKLKELGIVPKEQCCQVLGKCC